MLFAAVESGNYDPFPRRQACRGGSTEFGVRPTFTQESNAQGDLLP